MKTQQRNTFLIGMALLALIGLTAILVAVPSKSSKAEELVKTIYFMQSTSLGTINRDVLLVKTQTDVVSGARFSSGNPSAKISLTEFSDFQCPLCGAFNQATEPLLKKEFLDTGKLRMYFRDMPLPQHQNARVAARFAACAEDQGRFEAVKKVLFDSQRQWANIASHKIQADLLERSKNLGLDAVVFKACVQSVKHDTAIQADYDLGIRLDLEGTPSFVINGYKFSGALPIEGFRAILKEFGVE